MLRVFQSVSFRYPSLELLYLVSLGESIGLDQADLILIIQIEVEVPMKNLRPSCNSIQSALEIP